MLVGGHYLAVVINQPKRSAGFLSQINPSTDLANEFQDSNQFFHVPYRAAQKKALGKT